MGRYYPNLSGVDPRVEEAVKNIYDRLHELRETKADMSNTATRKELLQKTADAVDKVQKEITALPTYGFFESGTSDGVKRGQASVLPTVSGSFTYTNNANSITWNWAGRKLRWPNRDVDAVADGSQPSTALTPSTSYYYYPRYNINRNIFEFVSVTNGTGAEKVAYTARDDEAAQYQTLDQCAALSMGGMVAATTSSGSGGGGSGGGSGCVHEDMVYEDENGRTRRFADAKIGGLILGPSGLNLIMNRWECDENVWVELLPRFNERPWMTATHPLIWGSLNRNKPALDWSLRDMLMGRNEQLIMVDGIHLHHTKPMKGVAIECFPDRMFFFGERSAFLLSHNLPIGK